MLRTLATAALVVACTAVCLAELLVVGLLVAAGTRDALGVPLAANVGAAVGVVSALWTAACMVECWAGRS